MTDTPMVGAYRVVLGVQLPAQRVQAALDGARFAYLEPHVTASGLDASVTVKASGHSQADAEAHAVAAIGTALQEPVRVILTVSL